MMKNPKKNRMPSQRDRFIEAAHELVCDEDKAVFEAKLKRIAKAKPTKKGRPKLGS